VAGGLVLVVVEVGAGVVVTAGVFATVFDAGTKADGLPGVTC